MSRAPAKRLVHEAECANCQIMAAAQKKLAESNENLRRKLSLMLGAFNEIFTDEDTIDWTEYRRKG